MDVLQLTKFTLPLFATLIALEMIVMARRRKAYPWGEAAASFGVALGNRAVIFALAGATAWMIEGFYAHRLTTIPTDSVLGWVALFFAFELVYYWFHRWSHEVRWLWASHAVHHSANELTFSAAYRLSWTGKLTNSLLLAAPLVLIGFAPSAVLLMLAANLVYQFFLHTQLVPKLGFLEKVLNTPSHHRVHHSSNTEYLDANYGGVLIVFDRLFGTLAEEREDEPCRYGLVQPLTTRNPVKIAFHEWASLARDLVRAGSWRERFWLAFGAPGWSPDGSRQTSAQMKADACKMKLAARPMSVQP